MFRAILTISPLLACLATAAVLSDGEPALRYTTTGALVLVLVWLGKLLKQFFTEHLQFMQRTAAAVERQTRNTSVLVEQLRQRPCLLGSQELDHILHDHPKDTETDPDRNL